MTHTKGPWRIKRSTEFRDGQIKEYYWVADQILDTEVICCKVPNEFNARLIAAAPEMLEALERVAESGCFNTDTENIVLEIIAKARGEL